MSLIVLLVVYSILVTLASLAGGWLPSLLELTHLRKQLLMSVVSGVMLGVALLHMLPQSIEYLESSVWVGAALLCGLLVMFFLIRVFHFHSHELDDEIETVHDHLGGHDHSYGHHEHGHHENHLCDSQPTRFSWAGLFIGMTLHSLLDGVALSASVAAEAIHGHGTFALLGLGTFFAVFLHKPLDALSITSIMRTTNWSPRAQTLVNIAFALTCPLGILLFSLGVSRIGDGQSFFVGCSLAFSAGFFLCIALADLLPEVAFHTHDRGKLSIALLLGVIVAVGVEMTHSHAPHEPHGDETNESEDAHDDHHGHDH